VQNELEKKKTAEEQKLDLSIFSLSNICQLPEDCFVRKFQTVILPPH